MVQVPPQMVTITIEFDPSNGGVRVQAPFANRILCYGLLQMAHEVVARHGAEGAKQQQSSIVIPNLNIGGLGKGS